ncbi:MAG: peptidylprolyl isomerase [Clostridia bacterium]|nr:peptidylprolyl isomerase [Clostridia bacterium]
MSFNQICGSIIVPIAVVVLAAGLIIFGTNSGKEDKNMTEENVKVLVEMENGEDFVLELYPEYAPQTVQNFVDLVTDGFYDGVGFHRVVDGFMAQGGDPEGTGMGGSGVNIPGEFAANGFTQNTLSHTRGVISMARSQDPDSASSQFFICYDDASFLDGQYAAFGKVVEGMDTVDGFLDVERSYNAMGEEAVPTQPITMKKVTIIE